MDDVPATEPLVVKNDATGELSKHQIILIPSGAEHETTNAEDTKVSLNGAQQNGDYKLVPNAPTDVPPSNPPRCTVLGATGPITLFQKMKQREDGVFGQFRHTAQILTNPIYLSICITFGCNVVIFIAYLTVIVDFAKDRGIAETDAVFLVSAFSVGDLFGAVCLGWLSDFRCVKRKYIVILCFAAMGGLLIALPSCQTHALFLSVSIFMGLFNGCVMTNIPVVMREYLGLERLAVAVGLGHFFVGVGQLLFPMLIGKIKFYNHTFINTINI